MSRIPPVRTRKRMMPPKQTARIECPAHKTLVRKRECCVAGRLKPPHDKCAYRPDGLSDPHHSRTRGAYGGDETCVPLCRYHHDLLDSPKWSQKRVETEAKVSFDEVAADLARISDPLKRYHIRKERDRSRYIEAAE